MTRAFGEAGGPKWQILPVGNARLAAMEAAGMQSPGC